MSTQITSASGSNGISFIGALQILFIALKLLKVITWSWWWVLAPIWGSILVVILLIVLIYIII